MLTLVFFFLVGKALEGKDVKDLLLNVGSGGGAGPATGGGAAAGGAGGAAAEEKAEEKEEEKEVRDIPINLLP